MNREGEREVYVEVSVPHMRGDEPLTLALVEVERLCSPHAWG